MDVPPLRARALNLERRATRSESTGIAANILAGVSFMPCLYVLSPIALSLGIIAIERGAPCLRAIPKRDPHAQFGALDGIRSNAAIGVLCGALAIAISIASTTTMFLLVSDMQM